MQARFYNPVTGRFLSTDPIGYEDQLNLYAYVHNDPVNKVDPTGMFSNCADAPTCRTVHCDGCGGNSARAEQKPTYGAKSTFQITPGGKVYTVNHTQSRDHEVDDPTRNAIVVGMTIATLPLGVAARAPSAVRHVAPAWRAARSATQIAQEGGRHAGQLRQFLKQTPEQLQRTIRSFDKQIANHEGWIANPSSKVPNFSQLRPEHQQNLLHHWGQDISRHQELRSIAQDVLRGL